MLLIHSISTVPSAACCVRGNILPSRAAWVSLGVLFSGTMVFPADIADMPEKQLFRICGSAVCIQSQLHNHYFALVHFYDLLLFSQAVLRRPEGPA